MVPSNPTRSVCAACGGQRCARYWRKANTKPWLSARLVLHIKVGEKQTWAVYGNAITLADLEYTRVTAFQHLSYYFSKACIKISGQRSDGNSSACSLSVGRMFKDASPREKQKYKNWMLLDIPRGTKELLF